MKKIFSAFMIAICCLAMAMPAQAQLIKFGVKGGLNLSKLSFSKEAKDILKSMSTACERFTATNMISFSNACSR